MAHVFITGANRGIGLALVKLCIARGDTVTAAVRRASPELEGVGARVVQLDVTDDQQLGDLAARVEGPIDVLINNAGVLARGGLGGMDAASLRHQFEVNAVGPLRVTEALQQRLRSGTKVAIVTSRMGSIADNNSGGMYGYRMSKAAVNAAGRSLAHDLSAHGIAVVLLHPGYVRTEMTGGQGDVEADTAAAGLLTQIDALTLQTTGRFLHANGSVIPW